MDMRDGGRVTPPSGAVALPTSARRDAIISQSNVLGAVITCTQVRRGNLACDCVCSRFAPAQVGLATQGRCEARRVFYNRLPLRALDLKWP